MAFVQKLQLTNFRNFEFLTCEFPKGISLITGNNGVGKTNLLEAISTLAPGRGIRGALSQDICSVGSDTWNIAAVVETRLGVANFDITYNLDQKKKEFIFNGSKITQSELGNFTSAIWLTPQMDGLFVGSGSERRKFLDRLALANFSNHASVVLKYEKLQRERIHILHSTNDDRWLSILESEMAILAIEITNNRMNTINLLNKNIQNIDSSFPKAYLVFESQITELLESPDIISTKLKNHRYQDKESGKTNFGANKSDFSALYGLESIPAHYCSTGQQKSLLISIIMAYQISSFKNNANMPILLLDEVFVHLDDQKRAALAEFLMVNKSQVFITSTESDVKLLLKSINILAL